MCNMLKSLNRLENMAASNKVISERMTWSKVCTGSWRSHDMAWKYTGTAEQNIVNALSEIQYQHMNVRHTAVKQHPRTTHTAYLNSHTRKLTHAQTIKQMKLKTGLAAFHPSWTNGMKCPCNHLLHYYMLPQWSHRRPMIKKLEALGPLKV